MRTVERWWRLRERRTQVIGRLLKPDGYLLLGACETTLFLDDRFELALFARAGCYRMSPTVA